jgi:hypothetical protein
LLFLKKLKVPANPDESVRQPPSSDPALAGDKVILVGDGSGFDRQVSEPGYIL